MSDAEVKGGKLKLIAGGKSMSTDDAKQHSKRFRSQNGKIYSTDDDAFSPAMTTTRVRQLLNDLYEIAAKHDPVAAEQACKKHNA